MTEKHDWQEPVFIAPDQVEEQPFTTSPLAQEISPSKVVPSSESDSISTPLHKKKRSSWRRWLGIGVSGLLGTVVGSEIYRFVSWGFELHTVIGLAFTTVTVGVFIGMLTWLYISFRGLRQLSQTESLHQQATKLSNSRQHGNAQPFLNELSKRYNDTPLNTGFQQAIQQVDSAYNDQEIIRFVSERALAHQDAAAKKCIKEFSTQSGLLVALSPYATFDMLLVGWRNLKMLQQLAEIYGIAPGAATQWKLLGQVLHNIAFTGLSELLIDAGTQAVSTSVTAQISARASQGIGAGLFTLRTGTKAIELCRPLPLNSKHKQSLKGLSEQIVESLINQSSANNSPPKS